MEKSLKAKAGEVYRRSGGYDASMLARTVTVRLEMRHIAARQRRTRSVHRVGSGQTLLAVGMSGRRGE